MEALIIVALLVLAGSVAIVGGLLLMQRRPGEASNELTDAQRLEQVLGAMKGDLTQALSSSQQALQAQVNSVDAKLTHRLDAVDTKVGARLDAVDTKVSQRLDAVQTDLNRSMTSTSETIGKIGEQLGTLGESARRIMEVGNDVSSLKQVLRAPKLRGGFGELQLERILADCGLPSNSYGLQHRFPSGVQVDAVVRIGGGLVPVDSKFPMENFNRVMATEDDAERSRMRRAFLRDVQKHVDAVGKYILPDEGTFDFALMFIPAEGVYHETFFSDEDISDEASVWMYALNRRVIPVSPSNFYAYLYALVLGLRGMQVDQQAREIIDHLGRLSGDFTRVRTEFDKVGTHLKNASERYSDVDRAFSKFGDRLAMTLNEPVQAPLPDPIAAPAPLGEPQVTNGNDDYH